MQPRPPREILAGPRITLQRYALELAHRMFQTVDADREHLRRYLPWVDLILEERDEESYVRSSALQWMEGSLFDFGIFANEGGAYLGNIGAHTISWTDERCELGYWLSQAAEGKGIMSEALGLLETELFRLGFHRLEIRCNERNLRSAAVPRRNGYELEGVLKEDVLENGVRRNTMVWAKLKKPVV